jgi:hypothetical protein
VPDCIFRRLSRVATSYSAHTRCTETTRRHYRTCRHYKSAQTIRIVRILSIDIHSTAQTITFRALEGCLGLPPVVGRPVPLGLLQPRVRHPQAAPQESRLVCVVVPVRAPPVRRAVQVEFEEQILKTGRSRNQEITGWFCYLTHTHFTGSRFETGRFQAIWVTTGFNLYRPPTGAACCSPPAAAL